MFRILVACTGFINGLIALALLILGVETLWSWGAGISNTKSREEFGTGMFLGGFAIVTWILAAAFTVVAFLCWRSYRRVRALGYVQKGDYAVVIFGVVSEVVSIIILVVRFYI